MMSFLESTDPWTLPWSVPIQSVTKTRSSFSKVCFSCSLRRKNLHHFHLIECCRYLTAFSACAPPLFLNAGNEIFHYNVRTKAVDAKEFKDMPNCTSAFRFMEHFYCFHGHMFSKFDPKTGEVQGKYPKEARDYFMRCSKFSKCFISRL